MNDRILHSFTNLISTPVFALYQPGYLSYPNYRITTGVNLYTQSHLVSSFLFASNIFLIVMLLKALLNFCDRSPIPDWSFRERLRVFHAHPAAVIFYLLRSIHSECLIHDVLRLDTLHVN